MANYTRIPAPVAHDRFRDVSCSSCGEPLTPAFGEEADGTWRFLQARNALHVRFSGGDGEFIDAWDPEGPDPCDALTALLCQRCATELCDTFPWIRALIARYININVGHDCGDRGLVWEEMAECTVDPDRHGWRDVFVVGRVEHRTVPGPHDAQIPREAFSSREEADMACREGEVVRKVSVGNLQLLHPGLEIPEAKSQSDGGVQPAVASD